MKRALVNVIIIALILSWLIPGISCSKAVNLTPTQTRTPTPAQTPPLSPTSTASLGDTSVKIVFQRIDPGLSAEIYLMNPDGTNQIQLTNNPGAINGLPSWSPDRQKIAFVSGRDGNAEIYMMNADGSNQTRLSQTPAWEDTPSWSPDGTRIAFYVWPYKASTGKQEICMIDADGSNRTTVVSGALASGLERWFCWSPDVKRRIEPQNSEASP